MQVDGGEGCREREGGEEFGSVEIEELEINSVNPPVEEIEGRNER